MDATASVRVKFRMPHSLRIACRVAVWMTNAARANAFHNAAIFTPVEWELLAVLHRVGRIVHHAAVLEAVFVQLVNTGQLVVTVNRDESDSPVVVKGSLQDHVQYHPFFAFINWSLRFAIANLASW